MAGLKFNVCVVRKYQDRTGAEKTHYWGVGKAFLNERDGKKTFNIQLYSRTLMVDELVCFEDKGEERLAQAIRDRPNQQPLDTPEDDDIPF